jgi:hypothetical protein
MIFVSTLIVIAAAAWADVVLLVSLVRRRAGVGRWLAVGFLLLGGFLCGVWCGFFAEYHLFLFRVYGIPIPTAMARFAKGELVSSFKYPFGPIISSFNVLFFLVTSLLPLAAVEAINRRRWGDDD